MTRMLSAAATFMALVLVLAACGGGSGNSSTASSSSESSSDSSSNSGSASSGVATAERVVAELLKPARPPQAPPLKETPASGKTVAVVDCPVPGCKILYNNAVPATSLLGWTVKEYNGGATPESYVSAVQSAVDSNPDYIMMIALQPNTTIQKQLEQAKEADIPVWQVASSEKPSDLILQSFFGPGTFEVLGEHVADWVTAKSEGKAKAVFFEDPTAASYVPGDEGFKRESEKLCPECEIDYQQYSQLNIAKSFPNQVVSYLQAHPEVEYVVSTTSGAWLGVPQALRAAGLAEQVEMVAALSTPPDYTLVREDSPPYTVLAVDQSGGWTGTDALARNSVGEEVPREEVNLQQQFITPETVDTFDNNEQWSLPDIPETYADAWGVTIPPGFKPILE